MAWMIQFGNRHQVHSDLPVGLETQAFLPVAEVKISEKIGEFYWGQSQRLKVQADLIPNGCLELNSGGGVYGEWVSEFVGHHLWMVRYSLMSSVNCGSL